MSDTLGFDLPDADPTVALGFDLPEPQELADAPRVLEATEILDPEALVPVERILSTVQGITAADVARSVALSQRALQIKRIADDAQQAAVDALRDDLQAHERHVREQIDSYCELANKLHKGMTGLRNVALDRVPDAIRHAGSLLATFIREKREAEERRQREEREKALAAERARLQAEAEAAAAERRRLEQEAAAAKTRDEQLALQQQAEQAAREAEAARVEAASVTAPPVAAKPVSTPAGASTRDNWQSLPEHAEDWKDLPLADKVALIVHVGQRCQAGDYSLVNLLDVSKTACNQTAKSQKNTMRIPGIRAVNPPVYSKRK